MLNDKWLIGFAVFLVVYFGVAVWAISHERVACQQRGGEYHFNYLGPSCFAPGSVR